MVLPEKPGSRRRVTKEKGAHSGLGEIRRPSVIILLQELTLPAHRSRNTKEISESK
jgi:hypothetical protein